MDFMLLYFGFFQSNAQLMENIQLILYGLANFSENGDFTYILYS